MDWEQLRTAYRSIFSSIGDAFVLYDHSGRLAECNEQFADLFNCHPDDKTTPSIFSLLGDNDALIDHVRGALGGRSDSGEMKIALSDTSLYAAAKWGPLMNGGEMYGGYLILTDITDRKNREDMLTERYLRLHSLVSKAHLGIVVIDQSHKVIESNLRFADMLGYTLEEMTGLYTWDWEVLMPEEQIREDFKDLSKIDMLFETHHRRKDGSIFDVKVSASGTRIQGRDGEYNAVICICEDISAQKETERKLVYSERQYRNFVENAADIMCILDPGGIIRYVSPNCEKMWGLSTEEIKGRPFTDLFDLDDKRRYMRKIHEVFRSGDIPYVEFPFLDKEGRRHWYGINGSLSVDEEGAPILICSARNIDEKIEYEEKLRYMSTHDQLTGIYNRAYLNEALEREYEPEMYPISVLCCDIDGLKAVNDTLGHDMGDEMIIACARLLSASIGPRDILARIGGDEFVVILPGIDEPWAWNLIHKIKTNFKRRRIPYMDHPLNISIGHATVYGLGKPLKRALKEADANMYADKRYKKVGGGPV